MKEASAVSHLLVFLWTICFLGVHVPECDSHPQYHGEEEIDDLVPPKIFPKFVLMKDGEALEAADMLNTKNLQPGDFVNATELFESPHIVDLGGKTHQEKGNATDFYNTTVQTSLEETCKIPLDLIKGFQETVQNYTFPDDWLRDSRNIPLIDCTFVMVNNEEKLQCPIPDKNSTSTFITNLPDEHMESLANMNISCPQLEKILTATTNPTFICSDRIEGSFRITVCHIPKQWLKNKSTIAKLNCTDNENITTGTEVCTITKEIVQKNITNALNCESVSNSTIACLVPQEWMKYSVFSVMSCDEQENSTFKNCTFPNMSLTGNNCGKGEDGNKTVCPFYSSLNCTNNINSTKIQCKIPKDWLREGNDPTKLNCTDDNTNSTQKVCNVPKEWLRENATLNNEANKQNNVNESVCYIPKQLLLENSRNSQLNCSSDALTTVCHVPNEGDNITAMCMMFNNIKDEEKTLRCIAKEEGNFTTFVCSESENLTENCLTTTDLVDTESVTSASQNETENITSTQSDTKKKKDGSSTNETQSQNVEISYNQTTDQSNSHNSSAVSVPQLSDITTNTAPPDADNSTSVKLNTQKGTSDGVSNKETEHVNNVDGIEKPQSGDESNGKISTKAAMKMGDKTSVENEVVHYEPAEPAAAFSQLHSEHNHDTANEQTVTFLRPTESAAILVGVFIAFAVLGYAGLLIWRRMLEKRYGNRQLLINEDEDFNTANNFEMPMYELQERFWPRGVDRGSSSCDTAQKSLNKKVPS